MTFKQLVKLAAKHNIIVERTGRKIEWWNNDDHSIIAECSSVKEASEEVANEISKNQTVQTN